MGPCKSCEFWDNSAVADIPNGKCKRFPPAMMLHKSVTHPLLHETVFKSRPEWPTMAPGKGCGEFAEKVPKVLQ